MLTWGQWQELTTWGWRPEFHLEFQPGGTQVMATRSHKGDENAYGKNVSRERGGLRIRLQGILVLQAVEIKKKCRRWEDSQEHAVTLATRRGGAKLSVSAETKQRWWVDWSSALLSFTEHTAMMHPYNSCFKKDVIYLWLETEIQGEKHQCERETSIACFEYVLGLGTEPSSQAGALTGRKQ